MNCNRRQLRMERMILANGRLLKIGDKTTLHGELSRPILSRLIAVLASFIIAPAFGEVDYEVLVAEQQAICR